MNNIPELVYHKCEECIRTDEIATVSAEVSLAVGGALTIRNHKCTREGCKNVFTGTVYRTAKKAGYSGFEAMYTG